MGCKHTWPHSVERRTGYRGTPMTWLFHMLGWKESENSELTLIVYAQPVRTFLPVAAQSWPSLKKRNKSKRAQTVTTWWATFSQRSDDSPIQSNPGSDSDTSRLSRPKCAHASDEHGHQRGCREDRRSCQSTFLFGFCFHRLSTQTLLVRAWCSLFPRLSVFSLKQGAEEIIAHSHLFTPYLQSISIFSSTH